MTAVKPERADTSLAPAPPAAPLDPTAPDRPATAAAAVPASSRPTAGGHRAAEPTTPTTTAARETLGGRLRGSDNAFGFLRLVLAVAVVVHHSWPLGGFGNDPIGVHLRSQTDLGLMAVGGFFVISGFLITKSGRKHDVVAFLWHRALRILPAFWAMLVVLAFAVGPLVWLHRGRPVSTYFDSAVAPWQFVTQNLGLTINQYGISDLVSAAPYSEKAGPVIIGSAWTLIYEAHCYLLVAALVATAVLVRWPGVVLVGTGALFVAQMLAATGNPPVVPWLGGPYVLELTLMFMLGACVAVAGDRVPFDHRIAAGALVGGLFTLHWGGWNTLGLVCAAYLVLYLAAALPPVFRKVGRVRDISYGVYIWGFPVQQFMGAVGVQRAGFVVFVLVSVVASAVLGLVSWYAVEKWALELKDRGPGRGLRGLRRWWDARGARATASA